MCLDFEKIDAKKVMLKYLIVSFFTVYWSVSANGSLFLAEPDDEHLLVLFPGSFQTPEQVLEEFPLQKEMQAASIGILIMDQHDRLWMSEQELGFCIDQINSIVSTNKLELKSIQFGGYSSGGNHALLLANEWSKQSLSPKASHVFIVDTPVDLLKLYTYANIILDNPTEKRNAREAQYIVDHMAIHIGENPSPNAIRKVSPFDPYNRSLPHLSELKETKIRLYTEPDLEWWLTERDQPKEFVNSTSIQRLHDYLRIAGFDSELMLTEGRGYRANGKRHPHSWSIVDIPDLAAWLITD